MPFTCLLVKNTVFPSALDASKIEAPSLNAAPNAHSEIGSPLSLRSISTRQARCCRCLRIRRARTRRRGPIRGLRRRFRPQPERVRQVLRCTLVEPTAAAAGVARRFADLCEFAIRFAKEGGLRFPRLRPRYQIDVRGPGCTGRSSGTRCSPRSVDRAFRAIEVGHRLPAVGGPLGHVVVAEEIPLPRVFDIAGLRDIGDGFVFVVRGTGSRRSRPWERWSPARRRGIRADVMEVFSTRSCSLGQAASSVASGGTKVLSPLLTVPSGLVAESR